MASDPVPLAQALLRVPSVTPAGPDAFEPIEIALNAAGFTCERRTFAEPGTAPVENLFAYRVNGNGPHLSFAGHVDVVPPGDETLWHREPFSGALYNGLLHGRGAQDMKGAVAAMVSAGVDWAHGGGRGALSFLITGDEEGPAINGTKPLVAWAHEMMPIDAAVVGEPTSRETFGDTIKVGRRGSLSATVTVTGKMGHVAYQHRATNPVPKLLAIGQALLAPLDAGMADFLPSNLEIVSFDVGNPAWNVIPPKAVLRFNVRFNATWTADTLLTELQRRVAAVEGDGAVDMVVEAPISHCFLTNDTKLRNAVAEAVTAVTGVVPEATTGGGTSDARFIKDFCPVVEFGAVGDRMHQVDEQAPAEELRQLAAVYRAIIEAYMD